MNEPAVIPINIADAILLPVDAIAQPIAIPRSATKTKENIERKKYRLFDLRQYPDSINPLPRAKAAKPLWKATAIKAKGYLDSEFVLRGRIEMMH